MTRDDIFNMAKKAGLTHGRITPEGISIDISAVERFANLIAEAEREACALAAEAVVPRHTECGNKIAGAIRARSNHD
jgi:hypothetical protein